MAGDGIYNLIGRGVRSVNDYDTEAANLAGLKQRNLLGSIDVQNAQQAQEDDRGFRSAAASFDPSDPMANYRAALKVSPKLAAGYLKSALDSQETQAKIGKEGAQTGHFNAQTAGLGLDQKIKAHDFHLQQLSALTDPSQIDAWAAQGAKDGVLDMQKSMQGAQAMKDYAAQHGFEAAKAQAMRGGTSALEQLKMGQAKLIADNGNTTSRANNADTNRTHVQTTGMSNAVTMRGQNMTDARSKDSTAATMTKPFEVTGPDGNPMLVQQDRQGNISPVQGFGPKVGSAKPLNDTQAKALGFGTRMQEADKVLNAIGSDYSPSGVNLKNAAGKVPVLGGLLEPLANASLSDNSQKAEQAQRDFVNAVLRRESGAAISESEFDNARKQYFPEAGDSKAKLALKATNRKLSAEGVMAEVPKGQRGTIGPQASPSASGFADAEKERRYQEWKAKQK